MRHCVLMTCDKSDPEVSGQQYPEHMCSQVTRPGVTETPPDLHKPTPGPHMSIFHEMMVSYDS